MELNQTALFQQTLERMNNNYNQDLCLMSMPFSSPGYHTTLKGGTVHGTREALHYALMLLAAGEERYTARACRVIEAVTALQDQNPGSGTYGIWPWFYEESLEQMNPPDWNWADFCGKSLCVILHEYGKRLPGSTRQKAERAVLCACGSIMRRDADVSYTNVALMDCYVTIVAGQLLGHGEFLEYGRSKLRRVWETAERSGGFAEYNSPTYTLVVLGDLSAMAAHIEDPVSGNYANRLAEMEWQCIAEHFHVRTGQWAGPHSRCYHSILEQGLAVKVQKGVPGLQLSPEEEILSEVCGSRWHCPERFLPLFIKPRESFDIRRFVKDGSTYLTTEYSWIHPDYTLGSFAVSDFWNQRRNLISYYGNRSEPAYLHFRVLHDGADFTAAEINGVQNRGTVLAGIHFADDSGDEHLVFNKIKDQTICAEDIRLRFEFGGFQGETPRWERNTIVVKDRGMRYAISVPLAAFGGQAPRFTVERQEDKLYADVVLFSGSRQAVCLRELKKAVCILALCAGPEAVLPAPVLTEGQGTVTAELPEHGLWICGPAQCRAEEVLRGDMRRRLCGEPIA